MPEARSWRITIRVDNYDRAREIYESLNVQPYRVLKFEGLASDGEPVIDWPNEDDVSLADADT